MSDPTVSDRSVNDPAGVVAAPGSPGAGDGPAQIIDQGYRAYSGPRTGLTGSIASVVRYSIRSTLGLRRPARHKLMPALAMVIALVPALVFVGLAVVIDVDLIEDNILPDYPEYYGLISASLFFFCGIVVPDILVTDRRNGMLGLYLSTPLQRWSYLASKAIAVAVTLSILTIGPVLFLLVAYTLEGSGPGGLVEWLKILGQILVAGAAISAALTAASLAAASLTDRRAFASIGVILLLMAGGVVADVLVVGADLDAAWYAIDLTSISDQFAQRIYGVDPVEGPTFGGEAGPAGLSTLFVTAVNLGWVAVGAGVVWWRYRRLALSR